MTEILTTKHSKLVRSYKVCYGVIISDRSAIPLLQLQSSSPSQNSIGGNRSPQLKTPATTGNSTAEGLLNKPMVLNRVKSYDLRLNWLKYREAQRQFDFIWKKIKQIGLIISPLIAIFMYIKKKVDNTGLLSSIATTIVQ